MFKKNLLAAKKFLVKNKTVILALFVLAPILLGSIFTTSAQQSEEGENILIDYEDYTPALRTPNSLSNLFTINGPEQLCVESSLSNLKCGCDTDQSYLGGLSGAGFREWSRILITTDYTDAKCRELIYVNTGNAEPLKQMYAYRLQNPGILDSTMAANLEFYKNQPASGIVFTEQKVYALTNPGEVNAQALYYPGTGFALLEPIQAFWGWSVNLVFGFLLILIIIVAFAIMFRQSLNGSQIVTLQNSIPNIALAMILVPLSYAISGLFIDAITIGTNVVHQFYFAPGAPAHNVYVNRNTEFSTAIGFDGKFGTVKDRGLHADDARISWLNVWNRIDVSDEITNVQESLPVFNDVFGSVDNMIGWIPGMSDNWVGDVLNFFLTLALLFTSIRVFIFLLRKYAVLVLYPIISPFVFATIAIPGQGTKVIRNYLNVMAAASASFVVAYALFLTSMILTSNTFLNSIPDINGSAYIPPLLALGDINPTDYIKEVQTGNQLLNKANVKDFMFTVLGIMLFVSIPSILGDVNKKFTVSDELPAMAKAAAATFATDFVSAGRLAPTALDKIDEARGVEPGKPGSFRSFVRNRVARQAGASGALFQNNRFAPIRSAGRVLGQPGNLISRGAARALGGNYVGSDPTKPVKMEIKASWDGGEGGDIMFKINELQYICQRFIEGGYGPGKPLELGGRFSVTFSADNFVFPNPIDATVMKVGYADSMSGNYATRRPTDGPQPRLQDGVDLFNVGADGHSEDSLKLVISNKGSNTFATDSGKSFRIGFTLQIFDIKRAFGAKINAAGAFDGFNTDYEPKKEVATVGGRKIGSDRRSFTLRTADGREVLGYAGGFDIGVVT